MLNTIEIQPGNLNLHFIPPTEAPEQCPFALLSYTHISVAKTLSQLATRKLESSKKEERTVETRPSKVNITRGRAENSTIYDREERELWPEETTPPLASSDQSRIGANELRAEEGTAVQ